MKTDNDMNVTFKKNKQKTQIFKNTLSDPVGELFKNKTKLLQDW